MRSMTLFSLPAAILIVSLSVMAGAQSSTPSLGDYARSVRKTKAPGGNSVKVYDNDNLPSAANLSVVGNQPSQGSDTASKSDGQGAQSAGDQKGQEKKPTGEIKPGQTAQEREQAYAVWKEKVDAQKKNVDLVARELDVLEREYRLRNAQYYSDAGVRLRNQAQWDQDDAKYKQDIADKQKALESARSKLADLEEQARKAGVPSSDRQ